MEPKDGVVDTLERLRRLLELRGEVEMIVLVHSQNGLEVLTSGSNYVEHVGMLTVGLGMVHGKQAAINEMLRAECEKDMQHANAVMGVKGGGGVN